MEPDVHAQPVRNAMLRRATSTGTGLPSIGWRRSGATISPPLKAAIGVVIRSGSISIRTPNAGRLLVMAKAMPACCKARAAACTRGVNRLSLVTSVPSTSETSKRIPSGESRGVDIAGP
jgi:hypothetical protein